MRNWQKPVNAGFTRFKPRLILQNQVILNENTYHQCLSPPKLPG